MNANKFRSVTTGSLVGIASIIGILAIDAARKQGSWWTAEGLKADAQLERQKAESAKDIADTYAKNLIASYPSLVVNDYTLNKTPPRINWNHTVDKTKKTFIYDKYRRCVGYAYQGQFHFILQNQGACNQ